VDYNTSISIGNTWTPSHLLLTSVDVVYYATIELRAGRRREQVREKQKKKTLQETKKQRKESLVLQLKFQNLSGNRKVVSQDDFVSGWAIRFSG